jgi:hypothetical protein
LFQFLPIISQSRPFVLIVHARAAEYECVPTTKGFGILLNWFSGWSMSNQKVQLVGDTFSLALETLAFITARPHTADVSAPPDATLVWLDLSGNESTTLELVAGRPFCRLLASNLMGLSPQDPEIDRRSSDALKVLINVVGGALLRMAAEYDAQPPQIGATRIEPFPTATDWELFIAAPGACVLDAEGNTIALRMRSAA